jgi:hypothetical protein
MRRRTTRAVWVLPGLAACGLFTACGPIEYIANTPFEAAGAVAEAKQMKGDKWAPYEMTASQEYLHKSRELAGFARFHDSVGFAQKATKLAVQAKTLSVEKARMPEEAGGGSNAPADTTGVTTSPGVTK